MIEYSVRFRGLFAVVRHTAPPPKGQGSTSVEEPMTLLFPVDTGGLPGFLARKQHEHGVAASHGGAHAEHHPILHVPDVVANGSDLSMLRKLQLPQARANGFVSYSLQGFIVRLPLTAAQEPVKHEPDDPFDVKEPVNDCDCRYVGPDAHWKPLSRLANLNDLTGTQLAATVADPNPNAIDAVVRLSGGRLDCERSFKPLRDAFFEFFTDTETVAIQPAAEDVVFSSSVPGERLVLGLSPIRLPDTLVELPLTIPSGTQLLVTNLPPADAPKATNLNHFFNFYPLMDGGATPFLRTLARCENGNGTCNGQGTPMRLVHTMPGIDKIDLSRYHGPNVMTDEHCSCLTAQVFTDQPAQ